MLSNITLSSCLCWYATLNSYKNLKSETHLQNAQVNKTSSVNKGIVKTRIIVDMVRKTWSWIVVAGFRLYYFLSACFDSSWVVANFITTERYRYNIGKRKKTVKSDKFFNGDQSFYRTKIKNLYQLFFPLNKNQVTEICLSGVG